MYFCGYDEYGNEIYCDGYYYYYKNPKKIDPVTKEKILREVGTAPDIEIARKYNVHNSLVARLRGKKESFEHKRLREKWAKIDKDLYTKSDEELSAESGFARGAIIARRKKIFGRTKYKDWPDLENKVLSELEAGETSPSKIAEKLGVPEYIVRSRIPKQFKRQPINWELIDPLLGTMPDKGLGKIFNISGSTIAARRELKKIPIFEYYIDWTDRMNNIVRTHSLADAARMLGKSITSVARQRYFLGIPAHMHIFSGESRHRIRLSKEEYAAEAAYVESIKDQIIPHLGKLPMTVIAKMFNIRRYYVAKLINRYNILPFSGGVDWTQRMDGVLKMHTQEDAARILGMSIGSIRNRIAWLKGQNRWD